MLIGIICLLLSISNAFLCMRQIPNFEIKSRLINMKYENFKNYDEIINFLPTFQASIIINNWMLYVNSNKNNKNDNYDSYLKKSIYDMKVYIAINRDKSNNILLAWTPKKSKKRSIAYIAGGKISNNTLYLERIAQNPYYENILGLKSIDFFNQINRLINASSNINNLSLDQLNSYDSRYWLSLLVEKKY